MQFFNVGSSILNKRENMKSMLLSLLVFAFITLPISQAQAKNTPCSGKMGGVSHCSKDGKFVCKNGKISQSKKTCH
jgi:hypothetical protein